LFTEPVVWIYTLVFLAALVLAVRNRDTFPLGESLGVMAIVGVGFTGLVYWLAPRLDQPPELLPASPAQLVFIFVYILFVSWMLSREQGIPELVEESFLKRKAARLGYKLGLFVAGPLVILFVMGERDWAGLGFTLGDVPAQLWSSLLLILVFGGFNLVAGSAAAPIRQRAFTWGQLAMGFGFTYLWNLFEVGLVEEFFFRGLLQTRLTSVLQSPVSGILAASLLFGLAHAPGLYLRAADKGGPLGEAPTLLNTVLYTILVLSPTGWFMGLLFWRTQSLLAPFLVHAGIDTVANLAEFIEGLQLKR